jgi:hypothetical protein
MGVSLEPASALGVSDIASLCLCQVFPPFPKEVCKSPLACDLFCRQGETEPDVVLGELGPAGEELQRSIVARQRSLSSQTSGPEPSFSEAMTG